MNGIELIATERRRQLDQEGWTADHDAEHQRGELAFAACYYAMPRGIHIPSKRKSDIVNIVEKAQIKGQWFFPEHCFFASGWSPLWAKREGKSRLHQLVVAGALIAAEIDRIQANSDKVPSVPESSASLEDNAGKRE